MHIWTANCQFENVELSIVTACGNWPSGQRWCWLCRWLSVPVGCRCTCWYASPAYLRILCGAMLVRTVSGSVVLMKHREESFYRSIRLFIPRKLNTPLHLFSDLSVRCLDQILPFLCCCARIPPSCHFGHIQGSARVGLFQLYPISIPCHCSRHVENLQDIGCCF